MKICAPIPNEEVADQGAAEAQDLLLSRRANCGKGGKEKASEGRADAGHAMALWMM
jgi:hypothetical protein